MNWFNLIVVLGFIVFIAKYALSSSVLTSLFATKKQIYADKNPDINKRMKAIHIKTACLQKPKYSCRLVFSGDSKKEDIDLGKVVGVTHDRRVMEIAYKPHLLAFKRLLLAPNMLLEASSLNRNLKIRGNGIRTIMLGLIDIPVLREDDIALENTIRSIITDYWGYVLNVDISFITLERIVHNVATAPGSSMLDSEVLLQAEREFQPEKEERV